MPFPANGLSSHPPFWARCGPLSRPAELGSAIQQHALLERIEGVSRGSSLLELQVAGMVCHELFEAADFLGYRLFVGQDLGPDGRLQRIVTNRGHDAIDELTNRLVYAARRDAIVRIEFQLLVAAALRFVHGSPHGGGDL